MRVKEEITRDASISSIGMMSELELEILIDIRDVLRIASNNMEALLAKLTREGK